MRSFAATFASTMATSLATTLASIALLPSAAFAQAVDLFNGKDLAGWVDVNTSDRKSVV